MNKACDQYCPLVCDSISYLVSDNNYMNNDDLTSIVVFYQSLQYTLITQHPKTETFDFISSVGGILGLFIGISFVSLFEIGEVFIEIDFILFNRFKKYKKDDSEPMPPENLDDNEIQITTLSSTNKEQVNEQ